MGAKEGFLFFCIFVIREKRNFYGYFSGWSVPRTWSICFTNSPFPVSFGLLKPQTSGLEKQCQAIFKALLALLCSHPHCGAVGSVSPPTLPLRSSKRLSATFLPGVPQFPAARLLSACHGTTPWGCLSVSWGSVPVRAHMNGAANSALGTCSEGDKLCYAVLSCTSMVPWSRSRQCWFPRLSK